MKKTVFTFLICGTILLIFTGCGKKKADEHSFWGKILEVATSYIIVEPNEGEEERKISEKLRIELKDDNTTYEVNDSIKITYTGDIDDSYTIIGSKEIELQSIYKFTLVYHPEANDGKRQIIDKDESSKYNYNIYIYSGDIDVIINNKTYSLEEALKKNKITMETIIEKARNDCQDAIAYNDGGSTEYHYNDYTIIKLHTVNGNRDVYFGNKDLKLSDVK